MSTSGRFALRCRLGPKSLHDASKMVRLQSRTTRNDTSAAHRAQQIRQRTSRSSDEEKRRRRAISKGIRSGDKMEIFGMRPIDYSVLPPIRYTPPPPPMRKQTQVLFPATVLLTAGIVGYFYMNNNNDNLEYWTAMQSGEALNMYDDSEDDEDEEED